jgi:uncharacterized membrane protein YkvA (DUF1232 family)
MRRVPSRASAMPLYAPIGWMTAFVRFLRDRDASIAGKLLVVGAIAYVVMPLDLVPDVIPVVGWLDDLGVAAIALAYAARTLARYREESTVTG